VFVKAFVWVQSTSLMTFHAMTMVAVGSAGADFEAASVVGVVLVAVGLTTEALADLQKQRAKAREPKAFVRSGLFARTRHPNYLGEILFQVGVAVTGLSVATQWYGRAAVVLGPFYIVALMASMVFRGERTKRARYGDDPAFAEYLRRSGALLPSLRG
jgi:steroid 5-alpha reductase family enzyme